MSQEKVDQKKYEKTHRKSLVRKKKFEEFLSIACVVIIGAAIVTWIGYSIYNKVEKIAEENKTYEYHEISNSAIEDYLQTLQN